MTLTEYLETFITENRKEQFQKVLQYRTRYATVVLEDIYQSQNANAVLRTSECFGIQDVHIIENRNEYSINPDVSLGSTNWLDLHHYNEKTQNTEAAFKKLRNDGYRIVATSPHANQVSLPEFDLSKGKFALVFGTELTGVSDYVKNNADEFMVIPMYGFTESYNISVSAALCLQTLIPKLHTSDIDWQLNPKDRDEVYLSWLRYSIRHVEKIERRYKEEYPEK